MQLEILDEQNDEDFEPDEEGTSFIVTQDVLEYARYLGMSPRSDAKYLYIAREGLKAQLPPPWKPARSKDGAIWYLNVNTQEVSEEHPLDEQFKKQYIQAKQADSKASTGKQKKKLHDMVNQARAVDVEPVQTHKSKQQSLAARLGGTLIDTADVPDISRASPMENLSAVSVDDDLPSQLAAYEEEKKAQLQRALAALRGPSEAPTERFDFDELELRKSQLESNIALRKQQLREYMIEDTEQQFQKKITGLEQAQQARLKALETQMQEHNQKIIAGITNSQAEKKGRKLSSIAELKIAVGQLEAIRHQKIAASGQLNTRFTKQQPKLIKQAEEDNRKALVQLHQKNEQQLMQLKVTTQREHEQLRKELMAKYAVRTDSERRQQIKSMVQQSMSIQLGLRESELKERLREDQHLKRRMFEEELQQYQQKLRAFEIVSRQAHLEKEKQQHKKHLQSQLESYRLEVHQQVDLQLKEVELGHKRHLMDSQMRRSVVTPAVGDTTELKADLLREWYTLLNLKGGFYQSQAELREGILAQRLAQSVGFHEKKSVLEQYLRDLAREKEALQGGKHFKQRPTGPNGPTAPTGPARRSDVIAFVEGEKHFLKLKKRELLGVKNSLKTTFALLDPYAKQAPEEVERYNQSVTLARKLQDKLVKAETFLRQLVKGIQELIDGDDPSSAQRAIEEAKHSYLSVKESMVHLLDQMDFEQPAPDVTHYSTQKVSYTQATEQLLQTQHKWLSTMKHELALMSRDRKSRSFSGVY